MVVITRIALMAVLIVGAVLDVTFKFLFMNIIVIIIQMAFDYHSCCSEHNYCNGY